MDTGSPVQNEAETQGSWIPVTPYRPILPKPPPIYRGEQADLLGQANCLGSECSDFGCGQGPQSGGASACFTSASDTDTGVHNNWETYSIINGSVAYSEVMARWKDVSCGGLLALANATIRVTTEGDGSHTEKDEHSIPYWQTCDLNFPSSTSVDEFSHKCKFAPITPEKATGGKGKQVTELQISSTDDQTNQGIQEQNGENSADHCSRELLKPATDPLEGAVSMQNEENHNPDKGGTTRQKPRRKKHRPKVITEGKPRGRKPRTPAPAGSIEDPTGKRKYVRKKGLNNNSIEADQASADPKMLEPTTQNEDTLIFDAEQQRNDNSTCRLYFDFSNSEIPSQSTPKTGEGIEVTPKAVTRKRGRPKGSSTGNRKYVRKKGLNKDSTSSSAEPTGESIDLKTHEPTKEACTGTEEQPRDENSRCKSSTDSVPESHAKDFNEEEFPSNSSMQPDDRMDMTTPNPSVSQENLKNRRKYVRRNKPTLTEAAENSSDPTVLESTKKSCRRPLNFDALGQITDEKPNCKTNMGLDVEPMERDMDIGRTGLKSKSTGKPYQGTEVVQVNMDNTQESIAYNFSGSERQIQRNNVSLPEGLAPSTPLLNKTNQMKEFNTDSGKENPSQLKDEAAANNGHGHSNCNMLQLDTQSSSSKSPNEPECSTYTIQIEQELEWGSKRTYYNAGRADASSSNLIGMFYHSSPTYMMSSWAHNIHKKKRTEKGQNSATSSMSHSVTVAKNTTMGKLCSQRNTEDQTAIEARSVFPDKKQTFDCILALNPTERLTKKRSRGPTRVRNLDSLNKIAECTMQTYPARQRLVDCDVQQVENLKGPPTCREALVAEMGEILARKKRTKKRNVLDYSASCTTNVAKNHQKLILHNHYRLSPNSMGAQHPAIYVGTSTIDSITEQFKHLDITQRSSRISYQEQNALVPYFMRNSQQNALVPYFMRNQEQNALVLYRRDGTVVPFEGSFDPAKKRRPRPKVELDEETNRVWKLLLENINSEGIDGTDEEKAKWWEEERRVFHGRVDSFIARMHLVQGDRRFSPWKGSVVDSVVGVFLTQNVSDHLSSSAFMSLAARFPLKSQEPICGEETSSVVEEPTLHIMEQEETVECNQKLLHRPTSDLTSMTLHECKQTEEKEAVSSNESWGSSVEFLNSINVSECKFINPSESREESYYDPIMSRSTTDIQGTGSMCFEVDHATATDVLSSQNSVVSSQISMDLSIAQDTERSRSISDSNSEDGDMTNVSKLNDYNGSTSFVELLQSTMLNNVMSQGTAKVSSDGKSKDAHQQCLTNEDSDQKKKSGHLDGPKDLHRASSNAPNSFPPYLNQYSSGQADCYEILGEKTRLPDHLNNYYRNSVPQQSDFKTELTSQGDGHEAHGRWSNSMEEIKFMTERQHGLFGDARLVESLSQLRESPDVTQSSSAFDNKYSTDQKKLVPDLNRHDSFSKELNKLNPTPKSKGKRVGKEKKGDFDWDSLRRQVETDGKKRERPATTMDSLDYEAVRCADVNVIANTIKERGMNNMLAERIKDFLNRLVTEHGSIDLEWLRDVPPDQAKEYLLSVRGLGLKSVECVRLLTLHHLAFPVDTNVGRIAVRLGWVPLQPLPESLQLHLLELYPVLESIQKYLWPRLCKLDQRTLYELHYQMITFGKVFCTKSKPNCNACPMRGECRHFASAFASSRLALPGPEEKAIVSANEKITNQDTPLMTNQLPLPISEPTELLDLNNQSGANPAVNNCEPIIEEPTTPEPQCTEIVEKDIEDTFCEDPDEIPTIQLNMEQFTQNLQNYMQQNMELQEGDMSKALVALRAEAASIPTPKLKNVSRLRTEHQVYELPDSHPLLEGLDQREPDDPGRYLLALWTPGETPNSIQPPDRKCSYQENGNLCDEKTCFSCNSIRETNSQVVRGTLLIPCRTAMRGSFPLNGTYFQVNEVFADHDSSMNPINVPREWIWNLPRRTVFFGTSVPSIFKGLTTEGIQHCFWRGYVCVRGFDQKTRAPRPLMARLHFPVSKLSKAQGTRGTDDTRR